MNTPIHLVPDYLVANSALALRRLCAVNNGKDGRFYNYFSVQYVESEKKWYAWFYREIALEGTKPNANAPKP